MAGFTIPEQVLGIPLFVPEHFNYFQIEEDSMPNGDSCLVVNGAVSDTYRALIAAPTMSRNIFHTGDTNGNDWSMSCWLKLANLSSAPAAGAMMLGCSTQFSASPFNGARNLGFPLAMGPSGTNGFIVTREPLNNVASPASSQTEQISHVWDMFQDFWFLFVITGVSAGGTATLTAYLDSHPEPMVADGASTGVVGAYTSPRYLHLGAYHGSATGRADQWRIGKWAFHDHALTSAERMSMWQEMYGPDHEFEDTFNRATLGKAWKVLPAGTIFDIVSDQARATQTTFRYSMFDRDLGTPNHWAECDVVQHGHHAMPMVRVYPYAQSNSVWYSGGWNDAAGQWQINRGATTLATAATAPSLPCTIRLEAETNGSNNVDLRVYLDNVLKLSFTDSSGSKILTPSNAGLHPRGISAGQDALVNRFKCGTLPY